MNNNVLGRYVRAVRGEESLRSFAEKCGISHTHLDSIEKGIDARTNKRVSITITTLTKLAKGMGVSPQELVACADTDSVFEINPVSLPDPTEPTPSLDMTNLSEEDRSKLIEYRDMLEEKNMKNKPEETIPSFRASRIEKNTMPKRMEIPKSRIDKLKNASEADEL